MMPGKKILILLMLVLQQAGAFSAWPSVTDTLVLPSTHHLPDPGTRNEALLTSMLHYYCGSVTFGVYRDGPETITGVRWLIDDSTDAQIYMYGVMTQNTDTVSVILNYTDLVRSFADTVHSLTARIKTADGDSTDFVWRFRMVPTEFYLFLATVTVEDAVDSVQGDSIFTLSFGRASGVDTTVFSTQYDNCGNMTGFSGCRFDAVNDTFIFTDTLLFNAFSQADEYHRNNKYQYLLPFLDKKNSKPLCQVLYIGNAQRRFACIPVPFSTTSDEPPFSLEQAFQGYRTVSPLQLRIEPTIIRDAGQRVIKCTAVEKDQDASRLIACYDEDFWYFEESNNKYDMHSYFSTSYRQQFRVDGSSEVVSVSCSEKCEGVTGLTCKGNGYCPGASIFSGPAAARSHKNHYRVTGAISERVIKVLYRPEEKPAGIAVYSLGGRLCRRAAAVGRSGTAIMLNDFPSGLYIVNITGTPESGRREYRFVVSVAAH